MKLNLLSLAVSSALVEVYGVLYDSCKELEDSYYRASWEMVKPRLVIFNNELLGKYSFLGNDLKPRSEGGSLFVARNVKSIRQNC